MNTTQRTNMNMDEILTFLVSLEIEYDVNLNSAVPDDSLFIPASLVNIISNGIYYIQEIDPSRFYPIFNSVIIANEFFQSSSHVIKVNNPQLIHYKLMKKFEAPHSNKIHSTAIVSPLATIGQHVSIGPFSVIGNCIIENNVCLKNHVVVEDNVIIKENSFVDSNSVIGAGGIAWAWDTDGSRIMQTQLGGVVIEQNCVLATDVTVVRGSSSENTIIGAGTVIAHGTKIGHGSVVGKNVHMANNVSLAGNAVVGDSSFLGSGSVISSNIKVPKNTIVGAGAIVNKNFENEYLTLVGVPAVTIKENNYKTKSKGVPQPIHATQ